MSSDELTGLLEKAVEEKYVYDAVSVLITELHKEYERGFDTCKKIYDEAAERAQFAQDDKELKELLS